VNFGELIISGSANVSAIASDTGINVKGGLAVSDSAKVNATGTNDTGIKLVGNSTINGNSEVNATGAIRGIEVAYADITISGNANVEAVATKVDFSWGLSATNITITGGAVTATGVNGLVAYVEPEVSSKDPSITSSVTISGGVVRASGGAGAIIGSIDFSNAGGSGIVYEKSTTTPTNAVVFESTDNTNYAGTVYGEVTLTSGLTIGTTETLTIPAGAQLTIPAGETLTNSGNITNNGTITNNGAIDNNAGTVVGTGSLGGSGETNIPPHVVTFNATGGEASAPTASVAYGKAIGTLPTATRAGYIFAGWWTEETGGTEITAATVPSANVTYFAHWTENLSETPTTFKVTFNPNGGKIAKAKASLSVESGKAIGSLPTPTRAGYKSTGWYTAKKGGSKIKATTVITADTTYYAHWTAKKFTVKLNVNGGKKLKASKAKTTVTYAKKYGTLVKPARAGYTFKGWYTKKKGGTKITAKSAVKITKSATLYARWAK
jgi:uncharacterized repeat protein (TIGR02543 family)